MKFILIGVYLVFTLSGLIFIKLGGNAGTINFKQGEFLLSMNWISALGFVCYLLSFLLFTRIVVKYDLSYIMPIVTGIVQVLTLVASYFIFKEKFSIQSIIGASLIIVGIVVMNFKKM